MDGKIDDEDGNPSEQKKMQFFLWRFIWISLECRFMSNLPWKHDSCSLL